MGQQCTSHMIWEDHSIGLFNFQQKFDELENWKLLIVNWKPKVRFGNWKLVENWIQFSIWTLLDFQYIVFKILLWQPMIIKYAIIVNHNSEDFNLEKWFYH